ncbi:hypothetical protein HCA58_18680 [Micromonospora sp. HNM0581]|uniref:hypothetical protein n=1 Tax=Micromonospora sp. HNM0581 TaxID=2716341 RepID=UPI00146AADCE|nr:hypothetical protein [Micromonospora sp. HNM0581]NLU80363.1 hypothetical protein [Micromonospora sp. HNM0581]
MGRCPAEGASNAGQDATGATSVLRPVPDRRSDDLGAATPTGMVVAQVEVAVPVRGRPALPEPTPHPDQPRALADRGGAMTNGAEQAILAVHLRGLDGMCVGCRAWWSRLSPYPCWQVEWATSRQARASVARFLGGVR